MQNGKDSLTSQTHPAPCPLISLDVVVTGSQNHRGSSYLQICESLILLKELNPLIQVVLSTEGPLLSPPPDWMQVVVTTNRVEVNAPYPLQSLIIQQSQYLNAVDALPKRSPYTLRLRSDFLIREPLKLGAIFETYLVRGKSELVGMTFGTRKLELLPVPFHLSDFLQLGPSALVDRFWEFPLEDAFDKITRPTCWNPFLGRKTGLSPEQFLWSRHFDFNFRESESRWSHVVRSLHFSEKRTRQGVSLLALDDLGLEPPPDSPIPEDTLFYHMQRKATAWSTSGTVCQASRIFMITAAAALVSIPLRFLHPLFLFEKKMQLYRTLRLAFLRRSSKTSP